MSNEDNKNLIRRFYEEVFNKRNLAALDDFYAPDHVDHTLPPGLPVSPEGTRQAIAVMLAGFPDLSITIEEDWGLDDRLGMLQQLGLVPAM